MKHLLKTSLIAVLGTGLLTGCGHMMSAATTQMTSSGQEMAMVEASQTQSVVTLKDVLDAQTDDIPTLTAIGYAVTSSQPGRSEAQKRLMAIRSARMAAMRDLAEQIHGLQVDSSTTVIDLMVQNDTFRGVVSGTIRGARTVRINPTGSDTYEVVLEIDREMIGYLLSTARQTV
ncbi:MAG: LPP20 family lipoprotein [Candidatus Puniceispirillaceae bacterium]